MIRMALKKMTHRMSEDLFTCCFIVVDTNPFQLQVTVTRVCARRIDAMLLGYNLPKLRGKYKC